MAQTLQPHAVLAGNADIGVNAEPGYRGATRNGWDDHVFQINRVADLGGPATGAGTAGDAARNRCAVEFRKQWLGMLEVVELIPIGMRLQSASFQVPDNMAMNPLGHSGHLSIARRRHTLEADATFIILGIHPVQSQHMKMDIQIERIAEALNEGHGATTDRPLRSRKACPAAQRSEYRLHKNVQDIPDQARVIGKAIAQSEWEREHPLPDWNSGKDTIHKMGGGIGHVPAAARGAEAPALAGKGHYPILPACVAVDSQKPVGQDTAVQVRPQFTFHKSRHQATALLLPFQKSPELLGHHTIQDAFFGMTG